MPGKSVRRVRIDGDAPGAIITQGDNSPVLVIRGSRQVFTLAPLTRAPRILPGGGPAALLAPHFELAPFEGRQRELEDAVAWLSSSEKRAVRLISGPGGQGKSRLARQIALGAAGVGWQVMEARHVLDGGLLATNDAVEPIEAPKNPAGVLIIVDYADRWASEDLLELVANAQTVDKPLRILLVGRSGGFWTLLSRALSRAGIATSHLPIGPVATEFAERRRMFSSAAAAFTRHLEGGDEEAITVDVPRLDVPNLEADGFGLTLAVQMTALVAALRVRDEPTGDMVDRVNVGDLADPAEVSSELLIREVDHWTKMQRREPDPVTVSSKVMARAVFVATITRGLPAESASPVLRQLGFMSDPLGVIDDHALCYPPRTKGRALEPLYPDRLGEDFIASMLPRSVAGNYTTNELDFLSDDTACSILSTLLSVDMDRAVRVSAMTMLVETARRWPHVAQNYLAPAVAEQPLLLLDCGGSVIERAVTIPALESLLPLVSDVLNDVIGAGIHLSLDVGAVAVEEQLVRRARESRDLPLLALRLTNLSIRLNSVGRLSDALRSAQDAVDVYRALGQSELREHFSDFAAAVTDLAIQLEKYPEKQTEAIAMAGESVRLHRILAADSETDHRLHLANSLNTLSNCLANREEFHADALRASEEAVSIFRDLASESPDVFTPNLAMALGNFANRLSQLGFHDQAAASARKAIEIYAMLVQSNSDAYLPSLARSTYVFATCLLQIPERRSDALIVAKVAVSIYERLAHEYPDRFNYNLAISRQLVEIIGDA